MSTSSSSPATMTTPLILNASAVARAHTILAYTAFGTALLVGSALHYKKIVKNGVAGYPQEWFPSVSATIGDWYPERNVFQILIALTAGPRLLLVALQYYLHAVPGAALPFAVFLSGIVRTLSCGGWVYITSSDDHDVHDICMITYMLCNIPWMLGGIACTPLSRRDVRKRRTRCTAYQVVGLIGARQYNPALNTLAAYTYYSFFEWSLIFFDVLYDSVSEKEFRHANLQITVGTAGTRAHTEIVLKRDVIGQHPQVHEGDIVIKGASANGSPHSAPQIPSRATWRPAVAFAADIYLSHTLTAYVSISTLTSLIPTLFYFSVWELGIAGHELTLLATLSPFLIALSGAPRPHARLHGALRGKTAALMMHAVGMAGMAAYALDGPGRRLAVVAVAAGVTVLRWAIEWSAEGEGEGGYRGLVFALGLLVTSLAKHANHSNNPGATTPSLREATEKGGSITARGYNTRMVMDRVRKWHTQGAVPHLHAGVTLVVQCLGLLLPVAIARVAGADHPGWSMILTHPLWFAYGRRLRRVYSSRLLPCNDRREWERACREGIRHGLAGVDRAESREHIHGGLRFCAWGRVSTRAHRPCPGGPDGVPFSLLPTPHLPARRLLPLTLPRRAKAAAAAFLACISIATLAVSMYRWPIPARPAQPGHRVFNAGIWTVHFGIDNEAETASAGYVSWTRLVAEELGYVGLLGLFVGMTSNICFAAFPIINSTHHLLPSPGGELAPAIEAVLDIYGTEVTVVVAHNGQEEDPLDRELQSTELARIMASTYPRPVFFLGYVVTHPKAQRPAPYEILVTDGKVHDIDQDDNDRWCEYIFYRGLYRTSYARVSRGIITDTEMQIAQFVLPRHGTNVTDDSEGARYMRAFKEEMPRIIGSPWHISSSTAGLMATFIMYSARPCTTSCQKVL
ncbi:Frag1/DRAM/Sfk1 family-domain-containing protein [Infundibulicybe gibba]|nr:Frag1/DRAM/Sfk1 family-domain-containing protein [Infundibulicybe gibba]